MLCPNCGTRMTTEHKFCRHCGMNLEPVSRALAAHLAPGSAAAAAAARDAERRTVRRLTNGLFGGLGVVLFGMLLIAFLPGKGFKFIGIALSVVGLVVALISVLAPLRSIANVTAAPAPTPLEDDAAPATGRLLDESESEPVPSITERTTELLGVEVKDRKARE